MIERGMSNFAAAIDVIYGANRPAIAPNSGSSKRSPSQALSERTTHRKNMPSDEIIPKRSKTTAAAKFDTPMAIPAAIRNDSHRNKLCQA